MESKTINQHYSADHVHLHALFHRFQELKATDRPAARQVFLEFKGELERHIRWEESILFPCFDQKYSHLQYSPLPTLHREHGQILVCLDDIAQKLGREDFDTEADEKNIEAALIRHNKKEEQDLFPALDKILDERERAAVFRAMSRLN